jgi:hypothetical protein
MSAVYSALKYEGVQPSVVLTAVWIVIQSLAPHALLGYVGKYVPRHAPVSTAATTAASGATPAGSGVGQVKTASEKTAAGTDASPSTAPAASESESKVRDKQREAEADLAAIAELEQQRLKQQGGQLDQDAVPSRPPAAPAPIVKQVNAKPVTACHSECSNWCESQKAKLLHAMTVHASLCCTSQQVAAPSGQSGQDANILQAVRNARKMISQVQASRAYTSRLSHSKVAVVAQG